jgi:HrpA-like RNA helicase
VDSDSDSDDQQQQAQRNEAAAAAASSGFDNIDRVDEDHLDYTLLAEVVLYAVSSEGEAALQLQAGEHANGSSNGSSNNSLTGAVLVFLPGVLEISKLCRELERGRGGHYLQV